MKKKLINLLILMIVFSTCVSCTKMTNKMGLNFDSRFKDKNQHLYTPPFFEDDLYSNNYITQSHEEVELDDTINLKSPIQAQ